MELQTKPAVEVKTVQDYLTVHNDTIKQLVPTGISAPMLMAQVNHAMRLSPELRQCSTQSLLKCLVSVMGYGLRLGQMNSAWMIPYGQEATLILGYGGLLSIARRTGAMKWFRLELVYAGDHFEVTQDNDVIHEFDPFASNREKELYPPEDKRWGNRIKGAYCVLIAPDGTKTRDVMSVAEIERTRQKSRGKGAMAWTEFWDQQALKTVLRRCMKKLSLDPHAAELIQSADEAEFDFAEPIEAEVTMSRSEQAASVLGIAEPKPKPTKEKKKEPPVVSSRGVWRLKEDSGDMDLPPDDQEWLQKQVDLPADGATYEHMGMTYVYRTKREGK